MNPSQVAEDVAAELALVLQAELSRFHHVLARRVYRVIHQVIDGLLLT